MVRPGRALVIVVVLALAGSTACGTTANLSGMNGGGGGSGLNPVAVGGNSGSVPSGSSNGSGTGAGLPGPGGSSGTSGGGSGPGTNGATSVPGGNGTNSPSASFVVAGGSPSSAGTSRVPGVTATTITVGFPYATNSGAANAAIGAAGISQGNTQGEAAAVINNINKHGGIEGRKIVPVWFGINAESTESTASIHQSECQAFERDNHVFAIFDGSDPIIEQCAQQNGAVEIEDNLSLSSAPTFARYPSYVELSGLDLSRVVLNEAQALSAQSYFSPWDANLGRAGATRAKVGVISYSSPDFDYALDRVLLPALGRLGYAPASQDVVRVAEPQTTADISSVASAVSGAVLKFRTDHVDHVLIVDGKGDLTLLFLRNADGQGYHPRYGLNSQNGPEALAAAGDIPKEQLNGSMGIGWIPMLDIAPAQNPDNGPYSNSARRSCLALMAASGFTFSDPNAETVGLGVCATFDFLKAAVEAGGPTIDQAHFIAGVDRLGSWAGAGDTFDNFLNPAQHDGAAYYRDYQWNAGCGCMQYTSADLTAVGEGER